MRFATGLDRERDAVVAGLTLATNNGMVEGFVNKVKFIKRSMCHKASFDLLRTRVLHGIYLLQHLHDGDNNYAASETIAHGEMIMKQSRCSIVVVISANTEWQIVQRFYPQKTLTATVFGDCFQIELAVKDKLLPVVFLHGGWGKIGAAGSTQYAIDRWQPQLLINLGTCGGFAGDIALGEIVLANRTIVYDIIEQQGDFEAAIASYTTTLDVSWLQEYPHEVKETLLVSADRDLLIDEVPMLRDRHGAIAGDWESGAIAYTAKRNGVPCLILRGVSDIVAPSGNDTYGNMPAFVVGTELVMSKLLTNLPQWLAVIDPAIVALE